MTPALGPAAGPRPIDTDAFSARLRERVIRRETGQLLITDFRGSAQARDLTTPPNCGGVGRIRHFRRATSPGWPENPLPIDPAARALGLPRADALEAQVFQNAACNWRCWYCYVPFALLAADEDRSTWLTADDLVARYAAEPAPPRVIDLTGGQPDLVPEWVPWTLAALRDRSLADRVYVWSDDNLSNDYYFRYLSEAEREAVAGHRRYGRVCCFKGYSPASFAFNTGADPALFDRQFALFRRLLAEGLDLYAYVTLTTPSAADVRDDMARFVDGLQAVSPALPLRTVPLEIQVFTPVAPRLRAPHRAALDEQARARDAWLDELARRFPASARETPAPDVPLGPSAGRWPTPVDR